MARTAKDLLTPTWKKQKDIIDNIFEQTKGVREKMRKHYKMFQGEIWDEEKLTDEDSKITFNLLFSIVEAQAPLLTDNNPIPTVVPRADFMEKVAEMYNLGIKYFWDTMDMQMCTYKALIYAMTKKVGIFKVYFDATKRGGELCCEIVDPVDFFIAPGYDDVWKAPFCGVRSRKPLSWIRKTFPKVKHVKADASVFTEANKKDSYKFQGSEDYELDVRFATVYEMFIRNDSYKADYDQFDDEKIKKEAPYGKYVYFTTDQFLGEKASTDRHSLPPYVSLVDYIDPAGFLGIDEVDNTEGLIKELNLLYQAMVAYAHRYLDPSYEFDETQSTDKDNITERLAKGGQVFSKRSDMSKEPMLKPILEAQQNPMVGNLFSIIPKIVEEISGITDVSKGEPSKQQRQSASEVAILLESSHTRIRQKVRNLENSIKKICYILIKLMQQYFDKPRMVHEKTDAGYKYGQVGNSTKSAMDAIATPETRERGEKVDNGEMKKNELDPGEYEAYEDYKKFVTVYTNEEGVLPDSVYFDFDIQIDTNSTLPLDKQTLANMVIRLAQMKLVDREAVLSTLNFPNYQAIVERMDKKEQEQSGAKGGGGSVQQFMKETGTPPPQGGVPDMGGA